jgi:ring-1,2-phenylacetyl-CoA epoxidase subunit PaaE
MSLSAAQLTKPLKVIRRVQETPEAVSLTLEIPEKLKAQFYYQAGQFVTFFLTLKGETLNRSYSLSSSPLVDKEFQITVKKVPGGRASGFLCDQVKVGDTLLTTPPAGHFFKPSLEPRGVHYYLLAAGSGITPVYSIMKTVLTASSLNHVTLVFCNRNESSIIYRAQLERWARENPQRLDVVHVLSKPSSDWPGRQGRINRELVHELLEMPENRPVTREYYLCGPVEFMHLMRNALLESGTAKDCIKEESFGVSTHQPHTPIQEGWTLIGPAQTPSERPEKIIATVNGSTVEVAASPDQSILESLLEAGAQPPYSCMDGACMACLAKVREGRVYQADPGILTEDNIASHETLTCQAKPLSRIVRISYDDL